MARYQYVILSQAKPGRQQEFIRWYKDQHLKDVLRQPGVVGGRLLEIDFQKVYDLDAPKWCLLTLYDLETDDPAATIEAIRSLAGSAEMPMTDSLDKTGMVQVVGRELKTLD